MKQKKHEIREWQFWWPHWWKLWPKYSITTDNETYPGRPITSFTFSFGPFQAMGYVEEIHWSRG